MYQNYFPAQLKQWQEGKNDEVLEFLNKAPLYHLSVLCVDFHMSEEQIRSLGEMFAKQENIKYETMLPGAQTLFDFITEKRPTDLKNVDHVAATLRSRPKSLTIALVEKILTEIEYPSNLMVVGFLTGALSKIPLQKAISFAQKTLEKTK